MQRDRALEILCSKTLNVAKYVVTPDEDSSDWCLALVEARGYGIPVACYGDTRDKFVITPNNLGYIYFDYPFGRREWSDRCWDDSTKPEMILEANTELIELARFLMSYARTSICEVDGCCKGRVTAEFHDPIHCKPSSKKEFVVFVYGDYHDVVEKLRGN